MKRLFCLVLLLATASGAEAQVLEEGQIDEAYNRAAMFQVLHIERTEDEGYVYYFEPSQSFEGQDLAGEPPVLYTQGGVLTVRSSGVEKALVIVESDNGYPGVVPNALPLTQDDPAGVMMPLNVDGRGGPFLSRHTVRVLICTQPDGDTECRRWIEAVPRGASDIQIFLGLELWIIEGPELGGDRQRPVDD